MISGLYSALSGLLNFSKKTEITANNVANVNTPGFKASSASLQDGSTQSVATAGGTAQIGRRVALGSVNQDFSQGTFASSDNPTDMAIGGQGFFMLRQPENSEADRYSRSGGFRFNQNGYLTNSTGYYVQGWEVDPATGDRTGSIGDINLGKSTPPAATQQINMVVNVDSRVASESTEIRLFDAWDGRNATAANPTAPIDSSNYEYSSAIKIFDDQGASHDVTVYFDRTTNDNQWEFLVTANPLDDQRNIDASRQAAYAPDNTYNATNHKGAGALMYGILDFNSSGEIQNITAYDVPPDGEVEPAHNDNRLVLGNSESTYSFPYNFTGDSVNQSIRLDFGARFSGRHSNQPQVIVSDQGAVDGNGNPITSTTTWNNVSDVNGSVMAPGDTLTFTGYTHDGTAATLNYTVNGTNTVQDLLDQLGSAFNSTASVDTAGRLRWTDNQGGDSSMYIDSLTTTSINGANPFGNGININTSKQEIISTGRGLANGSGNPPAISANTAWGNVYDAAGGGPVPAGGTFTVNGTKPDGTPVAGQVFTVNSSQSPNNNVQDFLDWLDTTFDADSKIDNAGRLILTDREADSTARTSQLSISSMAYGGGASAIFGPATFRTITADLSNEDGSQEGDIVSSNFQPEELASTQYANSSSTIFQNHDGFTAGMLQSISTDTNGVITGHYSNGQVQRRAQISLATFNNNGGLSQEGGNLYRATTESGAPTTGAPGTIGMGSIAPNALEQSNVELARELPNLMLSKRYFQANLKIIEAEDEMLGSLLDIKS